MKQCCSSYKFDEFFDSGMEETISPFLPASSRKWAKNLTLRASLVAAICLILSYATYWHVPALSHLFLVFVYFLAGTPALIESLRDIKEWNINIDVLMVLAALLSVVIGSGIEGGLLLVLFALSGAMEDVVTSKTKGALQALHTLSPTMAAVINQEGKIIERSVREIEVGAKLMIKSGEVIPLDGEVIEGRSHVNLVHLTGEAIPISKGVGDEVQAGSMNMDGTLTVLVNRTASQSTLARIINLITEAQEAKPHVQRFLDRFGRVYATSIICLSALFALALPWVFNLPYLGLEGGIYRALAFLIAASPCALIIATPTAYLASISSCARHGVLLKGGVMLDAFAACRTIAFDKTGTLTTGKLSLASIEPLSETPFDQNRILSIAASIEQSSKHPIADAICGAFDGDLVKVNDLKTIPGYGIEAQVDGSLVQIGNREYIAKEKPFEHTAKEGHLITYMLFEGEIYLFHLLDEIRPNMDSIIEKLHKKLRLVMLSGDHKQNAHDVAAQLKIDEVHAELKPDEKLEMVSKLSLNGDLAMVGDGINDAPALARANVGIAMGEVGSSTAIEAADIVFLKDDLSTLSWLHDKAGKTKRIVGQNLTLALAVILLATTPSLLGYIPLWLAVVLHEGGTIIVALNSLRLLK